MHPYACLCVCVVAGRQDGLVQHYHLQESCCQETCKLSILASIVKEINSDHRFLI